MDDEKFEEIKAFIIKQQLKFEADHEKAIRRQKQTNALIRRNARRISKVDKMQFALERNASDLNEAMLNVTSAAKIQMASMGYLKRQGKETNPELQKLKRRLTALRSSLINRKN
jgi:hypothetical protein